MEGETKDQKDRREVLEERAYEVAVLACKNDVYPYEVVSVFKETYKEALKFLKEMDEVD